MGKTMKDTKGKQALLKEGGVYLIFGVLTTAVDYAISNYLFYMAGMGAVFSQTIAWIAAVLFAFVTNKWWVFHSRTLEPAAVWREFVSFVACRAATGIFTMIGMIVMVDGLRWNEFFGKLVVSAVSLVLNYVLSKLFIFKRNADGETE